MESVYHDPSHPAAFGGVEPLRREGFPNAKELLSKDKTYRKFKRKTNFKRSRIFAASMGYMFQADLFDMQKYAHSNRGHRYILIVVDSYSRYICARQLKKKSAPQVAPALRDIFSQLSSENRLGVKLLLATDLGTEFWNSEADRVYEDLDIVHFALRSPKKSSLAEISGRYLLDRIYRYMYQQGVNKWVDSLQDFVRAKNSRTSRRLGNKAPKDITFQNQATIHAALYPELYEQEPIVAMLPIGQRVQLALDRLPFHKSFKGYFTEKVYVIKRAINYHGIYRYTIVDESDGIEISGSYHAEELQPM